MAKTTWYVTIEDKTRWKKIKVEDTEMEVVEAYSKGELIMIGMGLLKVCTPTRK
jgi:hypothetical protein